jgi:hypothetical protein
MHLLPYSIANLNDIAGHHDGIKRVGIMHAANGHVVDRTPAAINTVIYSLKLCGFLGYRFMHINNEDEVLSGFL